MTITSLLRFAPLFTFVLVTAGGCTRPASPPATVATATPAPPLPFTKKVSVTIAAVPNGGSWTGTSTYKVGPKVKTEANVEWNGYGFIVTADGRTIGQRSDDLAFKNGPTATFRITKEISLSRLSGAGVSKARISATYTVKRGVKATF